MWLHQIRPRSTQNKFSACAHTVWYFVGTLKMTSVLGTKPKRYTRSTTRVFASTMWACSKSNTNLLYNTCIIHVYISLPHGTRAANIIKTFTVDSLYLVLCANPCLGQNSWTGSVQVRMCIPPLAIATV